MEQIAYSERQAAAALGISRETIRAARETGELRAHRIGARRLLIFADDLEAWIRRHALDDRRSDERETQRA